MSYRHRDRSRSRSPLNRHRKSVSAGASYEPKSQWPQWQQAWTEPSWSHEQWQETPQQPYQWKSYQWKNEGWPTEFSDGTPYPNQWKPDDDHLDNTEIHGLALGRRVAKTAWSTEKGLCGKPIEQLLLSDLAFTGVNNWYFRHLSAGRFTSIEFTRSVKESLWVQAVLKAIRSKNDNGIPIDLDKLVQGFVDAPSGTKPSEVYNQAAQKLIQHMKDNAQIVEANSHLNKVRELELQLQQYKNAASTPQKEAPKEQKGRATTPQAKSSPSKGTIREWMSGNANLPVEQKEEDKNPTDDEQEFPEQPHGNYARGKRRKVLKQKHPAAATTAAFTKWIKENLNSKQQTAFAKAHKAMMEFYNSKDKELKAELPDLASDWGLPVKIAAQADTQWLMKVLTAATIIAQ